MKHRLHDSMHVLRLSVEIAVYTSGATQNIFLCEFDGPRKERRVAVTVISDG
jgi:thiamine phosphate synthase YjbQ (UPF0047 family)